MLGVIRSPSSARLHLLCNDDRKGIRHCALIPIEFARYVDEIRLAAAEALTILSSHTFVLQTCDRNAADSDTRTIQRVVGTDPRCLDFGRRAVVLQYADPVRSS
jgi:hypothetical protein